MENNPYDELIVYKAICSFVTNLADTFGGRQRSLMKYRKLLEKTGITAKKAIKRHFEAFRMFLNDNREAMVEKDLSKLKTRSIVYSQGNIFIDVKAIVGHADEENRTIIMQHLLTLDSLLNKNETSLKNLREMKLNLEGDGKEEIFINSVLNTINTASGGDISNLMSGGGLQSLFSGIMNHTASNASDLDVNRLVGLMEGMLGNVQKEAGDDPKLKGMLGLASGMLNTLKNPNGVDPAQLQGMLGGMLGGLSGLVPPTSEVSPPEGGTGGETGGNPPSGGGEK